MPLVAFVSINAGKYRPENVARQTTVSSYGWRPRLFPLFSNIRAVPSGLSPESEGKPPLSTIYWGALPDLVPLMGIPWEKAEKIKCECEGSLKADLTEAQAPTPEQVRIVVYTWHLRIAGTSHWRRGKICRSCSSQGHRSWTVGKFFREMQPLRSVVVGLAHLGSKRFPTS